ncbi:MAG: Holliday junction resolvase RuvX [Bacteroidetes bacterium]|nr:Holliday junction resolvase RuvX [Bacteroidota bacterium]
MGRILAVDYGRKRTGIAVTDPLQMIAGPVGTYSSAKVIDELRKYMSCEEVERIVVGEPRQMDNTASEAEKYIAPFVKQLQKAFPGMSIIRYDERFTSKMASKAILDAGMKKSVRQDKALVDTVSAVIILQSYLEMKGNDL